ncbi:hypothetical protein CAPTEDRAFT_99118 [Capitella teleta]|uniref:Long-chain-fatty-acid--CoA ligase n=1 Tax=Capitella teleta TaxID=283909 RepID=R7UBZ7_CAPTE|nr:hypothetical protein CAPTEDRAFT_99118 [Capitella teleta]|eukprot:ELU00792.1 hypothetical protein CAPTEDRAFT_99118 [Capitella teleta]
MKNGTTHIDLFEKHVATQPKKNFLLFEDKSFTYDVMNRRVNQIARAALQVDLSKGHTVAILMENCPEYLQLFFGLTKAGACQSFINHNLRGKSLLHSLKACEPNTLIIGSSNVLVKAIQEIKDDLADLRIYVFNQETPSEWPAFEPLVNGQSEEQVDRKYRQHFTTKSCLVYIFTSGTTGLPKPAIISVEKINLISILGDSMGVESTDVLYTPLPLYHTASGVIALGWVIRKGATLAVGKRFSASRFWEDCRKHNATMVQYVGEVCRYLLARPESPDDKRHSVVKAAGNGLRADIWEEFKRRFHISRIFEIYGASEGQIGLVNNYQKCGSVGRMSPLLQRIRNAYFIKYDIINDEPVRDVNGRCIPVAVDEPGLLITKVQRGHRCFGGNPKLSEKRLLHDVFAEGDCWFSTGDLLSLNSDYYVYFSDRIGDTFRWKSENVSTTEVSNVFGSLPWIEDAAVYGVKVPAEDGRIGMAAVTLADGEVMNTGRLAELYKHVHELLPKYAVPHFIRLLKELPVTSSSFKQVKANLRQEEFDPDKCQGDPLYYLAIGQKEFLPLDLKVFANIVNGNIRF